ncbi:hypothetical protein ACQP2U_42560 (plasmid) [Nocardia sp. CA-084685]|uniref:hypothetical protein n=1 Tax=Nocardia sp. CA-084685 TaxID=3239970 RepID=UPI003D99AF71
MSNRFWRFHWAECPEFSASNAWSALWGRERSPDGSQTRCGCDGVPQFDCRACRDCRGLPDWDVAECSTCGDTGQEAVDCLLCDGTGWQDCVRGYSCCADPEQLVAYLHARVGTVSDSDGAVIVFDGYQIDTGFDDEPTAIPETIVRRLTWTQLLTELRQTAA